MLRFLATDIPLGEQSVLNHELNEAKLYSRSESSFEISAGVPFFTTTGGRSSASPSSDWRKVVADRLPGVACIEFDSCVIAGKGVERAKF